MMKKMLAISALAAWACGPALATDLSLSAESGGSNAVEATAGSTVEYVIVGELSDSMNEGLALFGFDLVYDGGDLAQALPGSLDITDAFVSPQGINNPAGFGGTIIGGDLIQVGGGQNTINNDINNAPFPIGMVITGIADAGSPHVLATGSLTIPGDATVGQVYNLTIANAFANVIREGETGEPPQNFWRTEAAGISGTVGLAITVVEPVDCLIVGSTPENCLIDARQPTNVNGTGQFGFESVVMSFDTIASCAVDTADFSVTQGSVSVASTSVAGDDVTVNFDGPIAPGEWTCVQHGPTGTTVCLGYLPADVNGDGTSTPSDILAVIDSLNGVTPLPVTSTDSDRSGVAGPEDILRTIDLLNGAGSFDAWIDATLPACPSE